MIHFFISQEKEKMTANVIRNGSCSDLPPQNLLEKNEVNEPKSDRNAVQLKFAVPILCSLKVVEKINSRRLK